MGAGCPASDSTSRTRSRPTRPGPPSPASPSAGAGASAPGMDGDLVVLDRDLLAAGPSAIIGTGVRLTVLGGRIVHRTED